MTEEMLRVKEECEEEFEELCGNEGLEVRLIEENCKSIIDVKEEVCEEEREYQEDLLSVEGLYEGHQVKRELVVGPEQLQPQDIAYAINVLYPAKFDQKQETTIRPPSNKTLAIIKYGLKNCSVRLQRIDYMLTFYQKLSLVKEENKNDVNYNVVENGDNKSCEKQYKLKTSVTHEQFCKELTKATKTPFSETGINVGNCQKTPKKKVKCYKPKKCFICDFCGKKFTFRMNFTTHIRTHTGEKPHRCEQCKKRFTDISTLIRHKRMHSGEKPHLCVDCGKKFSEKYLLVNHRMTHTGDKPYSCKLCSKQFSGTSNLTRHVRIHTSHPFSCDICEKRFKLETHLKTHILYHTKDKPFVCDVCDKRFIERYHLYTHLKTHVENKSHVCGQCQLAFSQNSSLKRHIQRQVCVKRTNA